MDSRLILPIAVIMFLLALGAVGNLQGDSSRPVETACTFSIPDATDTLDDLVCSARDDQALTTERVRCVTSTGFATVTLDERTWEASYSGGANSIMSADLGCDSDGAETTAFANPDIAAGSGIVLSIVSQSTSTLDLTVLVDVKKDL